MAYVFTQSQAKEENKREAAAKDRDDGGETKGVEAVDVDTLCPFMTTCFFPSKA